MNYLSVLGILIDGKCNWNYHINYIRVILSRSIASKLLFIYLVL